MLYVKEDGTIRLTRGDTARLSVGINNDMDETEYTLDENDTLTFTVRKKTTDVYICLQKTITGSSTFHIEPKDTRKMSFGSYTYDVQLTTATGDVYTIIEPSVLELMPEVTY